MTSHPPDRSEALKQVLRQGWLARQERALQTAILDKAHLATFAAGAWVYRSSEAPGGIFGIAEGAFGVYLTTDRLGPLLAHVAREGVWLGSGPILSRRERLNGIRALEPSTVLHVSLAGLDDIVGRKPAWALAVGALSAEHFAMSMEVIGDLLLRSAGQRIAAVVLRAAGVISGMGRPADLRLTLTQAEIAEMANASRDMVNRTLRTFARRKWIEVGYNKLTVIDSVALARAAYEDP